MEEGECLYSKYGYCKYKEQCTRKHYKEKCEELGDCKGVRVCPKRHPKACKRINTEKGCNFENECAYKHTNLHEIPKQTDLKYCLCEHLDILKLCVVSLVTRSLSYPTKISS